MLLEATWTIPCLFNIKRRRQGTWHVANQVSFVTTAAQVVMGALRRHIAAKHILDENATRASVFVGGGLQI